MALCYNTKYQRFVLNTVVIKAVIVGVIYNQVLYFTWQMKGYIYFIQTGGSALDNDELSFNHVD